MVMPAADRDDTIRAALARLIAAPEKASVIKLWHALTPDEREVAVDAALRTTSPREREAIVRWVARAIRFRPRTVAGWSPAKVAEAASRPPLRNRDLARTLLIALHLEHRRPLLAAFLDDLGAPHENGVIPPDADFTPPPERVGAAATRLLEQYAASHVVTYLLLLVRIEMRLAAGLAAWLRSVAEQHRHGRADGRAPSEAVGDDGTAAAARVQDPASPEQTDEFTTLDRQIVRVIVDAVQGIEGSLTHDELDDLIEELVELNSSRHRTYFHVGLRDAVLKRGAAEELPAKNASRTRWYWAGYIQGLAREERWDEIVHHVDERPVVQGLGDTGLGPSDAASLHVFRALCQAGRPGEATTFLGVGAVGNSPVLFRALLDEGTRLLRADKASEARAPFDVLGGAMDRLDAIGVDTGQRVFLEARRRRAHCYRQLGEITFASELLKDLLDAEPDPDVRSMALADLGLIDGGFRRLADLRLPRQAEHVPAFIEALERGEPRFRESVEIDAKYAAHARYCLGVLAFARERYGEAVDGLDLALSVFESEPARYAHGGLLATARLYLGVAICQALHTSRMRRAAELIHDALAAGAEIPPYRVANTISAFSVAASDDLAREAAEAVLTAAGPGTLDILVASDAAASSETIVSAVLRRAHEPTYGEAARVRDLRRVVPLLLGQGRVDAAARALDALEEAAARGVGRDDFLALLDAPQQYEPAWTVEDALWARIGCLEATGRYHDAAHLLATEFHRVLAAGAVGAVDEARGILERVDEYGLKPEFTDPLRARLAAARAAEEDEEPPAGPGADLHVNVLVVGGDERQARYDAAIEQELAETDPGVSVTFIHPGWSGNWSDTLDEVKRLLPRHDAIVITRFIRTEFGKQLRKAIDIPWRGCGGSGKRAIMDRIRLAAEAGRRQLIDHGPPPARG